jgi:hypothetical protein
VGIAESARTIDTARLASREPEEMDREELIAEVHYLRVRTEQLLNEEHGADHP